MESGDGRAVTDGDGEGTGVVRSGGGGGGVTCMTVANSSENNKPTPCSTGTSGCEPASGQAADLLEQCVALYNAGVRTKDFSGLLALLTDDATLEFEGTPERGPLDGKAPIAAHFRDDPPDDPIRVKRWKAAGDQIVAEFSWLTIPEGGGCLILRARGPRIAALTVALGGPRCRFR